MSPTFNHDHVAARAADAFADHVLTEEDTVKTWNVGKPGTYIYSFTVTWRPGVLSLAGDVGELTITHYHAMPTWQKAAQWINGSCMMYLLEKSNARTEFDTTRTIDTLIELADENQTYDDDAPVWRSIFNEFQFEVHDWPVGFDPNPKHKAHQAQIIKALRDNDEFDPRRVHDLGIDDYYGSYSYPDQHRWHYEALQLWARLVCDGLTAQAEAA